MAKPPRLNDLQLILLSTAVQREDGHLLPAAVSIATDHERVGAALSTLLKRQLVSEADTVSRDQAWRSHDHGHVGLVITDTGRAAIAVTEDCRTPTACTSDRQPAPPASASPRRRKGDDVLDLLRRLEGATIEELITATGWLPHTTRAALTGLRKKGHAIERRKRDEVTCYHLAANA